MFSSRALCRTQSTFSSCSLSSPHTICTCRVNPSGISTLSNGRSLKHRGCRQLRGYTRNSALEKKKKKKSKKRETKPLCTLDGTVKKCMLWTAFFSCSCRQPQPGWPQSCHCQAGWGRSGRGGPPRNECSQSLWMLSASHVISFLHFQFFWTGNLCSLVVKSKGTCVCQALVSPCLLGGAFSARMPERVVHSQQAMQP